MLVGLLSTLMLPTVLSIAGCSSNDTLKEDPSLTQKRVDGAKEMRSYFDKVKGKYDDLTSEDKEKLNKLTGSEAHSKEAFGHMVYTGQ